MELTTLHEWLSAVSLPGLVIIVALAVIGLASIGAMMGMAVEALTWNRRNKGGSS
ncbi:MAG: hypothetical protein HYT31_01080 [Parcubacteria group bacterium]|nr:hypothetical protein [Parcubacteria group bacterium]